MKKTRLQPRTLLVLDIFRLVVALALKFPLLNP
jgi:hypothetical protein